LNSLFAIRTGIFRLRLGVTQSAVLTARIAKIRLLVLSFMGTLQKFYHGFPGAAELQPNEKRTDLNR